MRDSRDNRTECTRVRESNAEASHQASTPSVQSTIATTESRLRNPSSPDLQRLLFIRAASASYSRRGPYGGTEKRTRDMDENLSDPAPITTAVQTSIQITRSRSNQTRTHSGHSNTAYPMNTYPSTTPNAPNDYSNLGTRAGLVAHQSRSIEEATSVRHTTLNDRWATIMRYHQRIMASPERNLELDQVSEQAHPPRPAVLSRTRKGIAYDRNLVVQRFDESNDAYRTRVEEGLRDGKMQVELQVKEDGHAMTEVRFTQQGRSAITITPVTNAAHVIFQQALTHPVYRGEVTYTSSLDEALQLSSSVFYFGERLNTAFLALGSPARRILEALLRDGRVRIKIEMVSGGSVRLEIENLEVGSGLET
ncbi:hypothetical protein MMC25_001064 [Agyrium rufum]|nr:hypothetical protein [Agyrium rufum]